jgi:uncharacterized protein CbrC (UPF0167 family)
MMEHFGKAALSPSYTRKAHFKSGASLNDKYIFDCLNCGKPISVSYQLLIRAAGQWETTIGAEFAKAAKDFYKIGVMGKSQDGGSPSMLQVSCDSCGARYLVYAGIDEYYNSLYRVTIQGITELLGAEGER